MSSIFCIVSGKRVHHVVKKEFVDKALNAWRGIYKDAKAVPLEDVIDTSKPVVTQVRQLFSKMDYPYEIWEENGKIFVEIEWGDWKHDHRNADYVMVTAFGYDVIDENVTREDGSDAYGAIHTYVPA